MKNIHVLATDKPSKIGQSFFDKSLHFNPIFNYELEKERVIPQHIYITNDEEIKEGDWFIRDGSIHKCFRVHKTDIEFLTSIDSVYCGSNTFWSKEFCKKIILTTDQDLIKDGVQAIPDEFLNWFVNNPSCEYVNITTYGDYLSLHYSDLLYNVYKIIIPKGCDGHETLEEAAECKSHHSEEDFIRGAKWQAERSYSEEEVLNILDKFLVSMLKGEKTGLTEKWFEQFKK